MLAERILHGGFQVRYVVGFFMSGDAGIALVALLRTYKLLPVSAAAGFAAVVLCV